MLRVTSRGMLTADVVMFPQEPIMPEKAEDQILEEALKDYKDYLALEQVILRDMGLLVDTDD